MSWPKKGGGKPPEATRIYEPKDERSVAIDQSVQKAEKSLQASGQELIASSPCRPAYGEKGTAVTVWANYVHLKPKAKLTFHRYSITVSPAAVGKKLTRIVKLLLETPDMKKHKLTLATDFKSTIITKEKLADDPIIVGFKFVVENEDEPRRFAVRYTIHVKYTNTLSIDNLVKSLQPTSLDNSIDRQPMVQALNIFLNHYSKANDNHATIGANKTFSVNTNPDTADLGSGLAAIRGFFSSVRVATSRILVNINVSHAAFYQTGTLIDLIKAYQAVHGDSTTKLKGFLNKLRVMTHHLKKPDDHGNLQSAPKVRTICGFAEKGDGSDQANKPVIDREHGNAEDVQFWLDPQTDPSPSTGGPKEAKKGKGKGRGKGKGKGASDELPTDGGYVTVARFFKCKHGFEVKSGLPVINIGTKGNPSYIPVDVCTVMPGQAYTRALESSQTMKMIDFAVRRPWQNANSIVDHGFGTTGLSSQNTLLSHFKIDIPQDLIKVNARVLNKPSVVYKPGDQVQMWEGAWNPMKDKKVAHKFHAKGRDLNLWKAINIERPNKPKNFSGPIGFKETILVLKKTLLASGITVADPQGESIQVRGESTDKQFEPIFEACRTDGYDLLVFILPEEKSKLYPYIKYLGDVKHGIHTLCCVGSKISNPSGQEQYMRNLALKVNLKLGGTNYTVSGIDRSIIKEGKTMIVGIDVTHPSPGSSENAPSIAGMVASVDSLLGQWPATVLIQPKPGVEEVKDNLTEMLRRHLLLWKKRNRDKFPENILVYRDGVSEGQYDRVLQIELPNLQAAAKNLYPAPEQKRGLPRFTIVICGKRHHTRFYPISTSKDQLVFNNCKPGTVVDRGVTASWNWDFYLQAHVAIKGTARPAHYHVLYDEIFRDYHRKKINPFFSNAAESLEDLTHCISYTFGRATRALSICPPARYADMVCDRARCYLNRLYNPSTSAEAGNEAAGSNDDIIIHKRLEDTMYYL